MKKHIILLILVLLLLIICIRRENFEEITTNKCCLVQKKYLQDDDSYMGGKFKYIYNILEDDKCDRNLYKLNHENELLFDGLNNWSNNNCNEYNTVLGSCRNVNKECIDFVDKNYCDKYNMKWSNKTCNENLDFIWIDRTNFTMPVSEDPTNGEFKLFDKKTILNV